MAEYVVLLFQDEQAVARATPEQRSELLAAHGAFQRKHGAAVRAGDALQRTRTARTLRTGGDTLTVTDGPFSETKEALGGFYLIEADDLDVAIAIAKDVPAPTGGVEVRPVLVSP